MSDIFSYPLTLSIVLFAISLIMLLLTIFPRYELNSSSIKGIFTSLMSLILGIVFLRAYMAPKTGIISGEVCYPSEYYPAMTIYLRNTESQKIRKTETKEGEKDFIFENIGKGEYVVYAYTNEQLVGNEGDPFKEKAHGGYTFAVICGLSVECENHNLVPVDVNPGDELTDIKICDWYGAVVPPE